MPATWPGLCGHSGRGQEVEVEASETWAVDVRG